MVMRDRLMLSFWESFRMKATFSRGTPSLQSITALPTIKVTFIPIRSVLGLCLPICERQPMVTNAKGALQAGYRVR